MKNKANTTMAIKCKASNQIHKILDPKPCRTRDKWRKENQVTFTDMEKIKLFDQIMNIDKQCSDLLGRANYNHREKKRITALQIARNGNRAPKVRMTKEQWEATKVNKAA